MAKRKPPKAKRPAPAKPDDLAPKKVLSVALLMEQIPKLSGNLSAVARSFGVSRMAVWEYVERHPELKAVTKDARESMKDNVESRFYADCLRDDPAYQTSRIFFLKTQAKDRGYIEKQELNLSGGLGFPDLSNVPDDLQRAIAEGVRLAGLEPPA